MNIPKYLYYLNMSLTIINVLRDISQKITQFLYTLVYSVQLNTYINYANIDINISFIWSVRFNNPI